MIRDRMAPAREAELTVVRPRDWLLALIVALPFGGLYAWLGALHREAELALFYDYFFRGDPSVLTGVLTDPVGGARRALHPLLAIVVGTPASWLVALGLERATVACGAVHAGGVAMLVFWQLALQRVGCSVALRAVATALLGLSFAPLCFAVVPESFVFGAAAVLAAALVVLPSRPRLWALTAAAAACFGSTITNLCAFGAMAAAAAQRGAFWAVVGRALAAAALAVAAVVAVVAANELGRDSLQSLHVDPGAERQWVWAPQSLRQRLAELGTPVVAPPLLIEPAALCAPAAFEPLRQLGSRGTALVVNTDPERRPEWPIWLSLALLVAAATLRQVAPAPQLLARVLLANLGFQLAMHSVYGDHILPCGMHWVFAMVAGPVLLAHGRGPWAVLLLLAAAAGLGFHNLRSAFDLVAAHAAFRPHAWELAPAAGRAFTASGRLPLDAGRARPFLLYPDPRAALDQNAPFDRFQLPPFRLPLADWRWLGEGRIEDGAVTAAGELPPDVGMPAWISLYVDGSWRGIRVVGYVFPQRLPP